MVNKIVLEYLRVNRGNYKIGALKKKILSAGYLQKEIDGAIAHLNLEGKGNVPTVSSTINKINKTNISQKPVVQSQPKVQAQVQTAKTPAQSAKMQTARAQMQPIKKSRKWLWIILGMVFLLLLIVGGVVWYFFDNIKELFVG